MNDVANEKNWTRVPIASLQAPKHGGLHMIYCNAWWAIDANQNAFFYHGTSPQCNANRSVVEHIKTHPDIVDIVQLPVAMWPVRASDYA